MKISFTDIFAVELFIEVIYREDTARARKDNSPLNMNVLRKTAMALVNQEKCGRLSKKNDAAQSRS